MNERKRYYKSRGNRGKGVRNLSDVEKAQVIYAVKEIHEQFDKYKNL